MTTPRLVVLKFGGSVLRDEESLTGAVHEVYRWRREGWRVLAVVSALAGRTDALLAQADRLGLDENSHARAAMAGGGERESAALLAALLERAGLPCACLPAGIRARGAAADARPVGARTARLKGALERHGVVVCAGYVARDARGQAMLLGRGGSDLTALSLAHALDATRCILVKDVDGLYDRDPAPAGGAARRYLAAGWDDALATDGSIIQHKAVRFARAHSRGFELGCLNASSWSVIGMAPARLAEPAPPPRPLRVALLGHGHVGGGVARLLAAQPGRFRLAGIAARDPRQHAGAPAAVTGDPLELVEADVDIVVELLGGLDPARRVTEAALRRGLPVVTANKDLLAACGPALLDLARRHGGRILASAAVGGSVPVLEAATRPGTAPVVSLAGVLNGTANFVLERGALGHDLGAAVAEARRLGLAEADPGRDLDGRDAAAKLCAVALACGDGRPLREEDVSREPIEASSLRPGLRQVAMLDRRGDNWLAHVRLALPGPRSPLRRTTGAGNTVRLRRADGSVEWLRGAGAGRWPTAEAVMADLWQLAREARDAG